MSRVHAAIASAALWIATINGAIWLGGTLFMMLVFNPLWTASPPESVHAYWVEAGFSRTIFNFFGGAWVFVGSIPVVVALVACWSVPRQRTWLLMSLTAKVIGVTLTRAYIYPINDQLFTPAISSLSAEAARELTDRWIAADRIRFVAMSVGFIALLQAFRLPAQASVIGSPAVLRQIEQGSLAGLVRPPAVGAAAGRTRVTRTNHGGV